MIINETPPLFSKLAVAPMIDWTYNHFRFLMRLLAPGALLYTEMLTTGAILNNPNRLYEFDIREMPLALQLGGSEAAELMECARLAEQAGFVEVNLNLGCPSDRVQSGRFGACLMSHPDLVAQCIQNVKQSVSIPVTAKIRIGIDNDDSFSFFYNFAEKLIHAGCNKLIVHARKAWLKGLSPKQNRTIPPLQYDYVYRLKQQFKAMPVVINGNISDLSATHYHLTQVDGVMIGRLACQNPYLVSEIYHALYPEHELPDRKSILESYLEYMSCYTNDSSWSFLIKPLFNLAHGLPGAKLWRQSLLTVQQTKDLAPIRRDLLEPSKCELNTFA